MGWAPILNLASTEDSSDLEALLASWGIKVVSVASILIVILLLYTSRQKRMKNKKKKSLFTAITSLIAITTIFLFGTTIYLNSVSDSRGPVHWHADIEFWVCGSEIELRDPSGALSNKIGSPTYHEHDDKRIHLEGVVVDKAYDASLEKFMKVTGGSIDNESIVIPTTETFIEDDTDGDESLSDPTLNRYLKKLDSGWVMQMNNGDRCGESPAELQAFVYKYDKESNTYSQTKLAEPEHYVLRDESTVPPGDCVIVEFDARKSKTNKLCLQYGIRDSTRCEEFSGGKRNDKLCTIYETTGGAQ